MKIEENNITLKNYKEPLLAVPADKGFGYYGVLLATKDGQYVQCHICGDWFEELPHHFRAAHKLNKQEYLEEFGLARTTALVSDNFRMKSKKRFLEWYKALPEEEKAKWKKSAMKNLKKASDNRKPSHHVLRLESKNKRGTCPDQLLAKIREVKEKIGHVPSKLEFIQECGTQRYVHLIYKVYGSWTNALYLIGMQPNPSGIIKGDKKPKYSDEELLEYLRIFAEENNEVPTYTDFKRDYLPAYSIYTKRFGGIENARQLAGVYDFLES